MGKKEWPSWGCRDIDVRTDFTDELVQTSNDVSVELTGRLMTKR